MTPKPRFHGLALACLGSTPLSSDAFPLALPPISGYYFGTRSVEAPSELSRANSVTSTERRTLIGRSDKPPPEHC